MKIYFLVPNKKTLLNNRIRNAIAFLLYRCIVKCSYSKTKYVWSIYPHCLKTTLSKAEYNLSADHDKEVCAFKGPSKMSENSLGT